jgi:AcrR family transcriptional regulator
MSTGSYVAADARPAGRGRQRPRRREAPDQVRGRRGLVTRNRIVASATQLFSTLGYENTSIDAVLRSAEVSRGALYHHFGSKEALFDAVLATVEADIGRQTQAAARAEKDPVAALRAGCLAWVRLAGDPVVQRILLIDAPAVIGWQRWRAMDEGQALGQIKRALQAAAALGRLQPDLVDMFAHVVLASVNEIALVIARAPDPKAATREGEVAVDALLERLFKR